MTRETSTQEAGTIEADPLEHSSPALPEIALGVADALLEDVDRGIARTDPADMARLGRLSGDAVAITDRRIAVALVRLGPDPDGRRHSGERPCRPGREGLR